LKLGDLVMVRLISSIPFIGVRKAEPVSVAKGSDEL